LIKDLGYFEPREVKVGAKVDDYYEVTKDSRWVRGL